jgi:hypothetical protein
VFDVVGGRGRRRVVEWVRERVKGERERMRGEEGEEGKGARERKV